MPAVQTYAVEVWLVCMCTPPTRLLLLPWALIASLARCRATREAEQAVSTDRAGPERPKV